MDDLVQIRIKKGLDLPISGDLIQTQLEKRDSSYVAVVGADFTGMKPSLKVKVGDTVEPGQVLFSCKKNEGLNFCSRVAGTVKEINRGEKEGF